MKCYVIENKIFKDHRGTYRKLYGKDTMPEGLNLEFVEVDVSFSWEGALRGIHSDNKAWKLVSCIKGTMFLVIVDCDKSSKTFGEFESFHLTDRDERSVLVPPNHGVAHLALTQFVMFHYLQSEPYDINRQTTYKWDDPKFAIPWPVNEPLLSERDRGAKLCE